MKRRNGIGRIFDTIIAFMIYKKHAKLRRMVASSIAGVVVFTTTYLLILPALTADIESVDEIGMIMSETQGDLYEDSLYDYEAYQADNGGILIDDRASEEVYDYVPTENWYEEGDLSSVEYAEETYSEADTYNEFSLLPDEETNDPFYVEEASESDPLQGLSAGGEESVVPDTGEPNTDLDENDPVVVTTYEVRSEARGVDLKLTYPEPLSADTEVIFEEIDSGNLENYFYSADEEIKKYYEGHSIVSGQFWHIISADSSYVEVEFCFKPAVFDDHGNIIFSSDPEYVLHNQLASDSNGQILYSVAGLREAASSGNLLLIDWSADEWHLYNPETVRLEEEDYTIKITTTTDSLINPTVDFGIVILDTVVDEQNNEEFDNNGETEYAGETGDEYAEASLPGPEEGEVDEYAETSLPDPQEGVVDEYVEEPPLEIEQGEGEENTEEPAPESEEGEDEENAEEPAPASEEGEDGENAEESVPQSEEGKKEPVPQSGAGQQHTQENREKPVPEKTELHTPAGDHVVPVKGADYSIRVKYDENAGVPADSEIVASVVKDAGFAKKALDAVKEAVDGSDEENTADTDDRLGMVTLFDLTIYSNGSVIQPKAPISVSVVFDEDRAENEEIYAVHFPGTGEQPDESQEVAEEQEEAYADTAESYTEPAIEDYIFETEPDAGDDLIQTAAVEDYILEAEPDDYADMVQEPETEEYIPEEVPNENTDTEQAPMTEEYIPEELPEENTVIEQAPITEEYISEDATYVNVEMPQAPETQEYVAEDAAYENVEMPQAPETQEYVAEDAAYENVEMSQAPETQEYVAEDAAYENAEMPQTPETEEYIPEEAEDENADISQITITEEYPAEEVPEDIDEMSQVSMEEEVITEEEPEENSDLMPEPDEQELESDDHVGPEDTVAEVLRTVQSADSVTFTTDGLSYYALVSYTVDFHCEINGKEFSFSIPGGGFATISEIVQLAGMGEMYKPNTPATAGSTGEADRDEMSDLPAETAVEENTKQNDDMTEETDSVQKFVKEIDDISFTNPSLLSVSKVETDTTLGEIRKRLGLESEFSVKLSEEQINDIDAAVIRGIDWALISLKPFETEETLTVTMKNGDVFTIKVTDAQLSGLSNIDPDRGYLIYTERDGKYYVLKNDLTTTEVDKSSSAMERLGKEYLWRFEEGNGSYIIRTYGLDEIYQMRLHSDWRLDQQNLISWNNYISVIEYPETEDIAIRAYSGRKIYLNNYNQFEDNNLNLETRVKLWEQEKRYFTVSSANIQWGRVSGSDSTGEDQKLVSNYLAVSKTAGNGYTNNNKITAVETNGYTFDHWELDGTPLSATEYPQEIPAGSLVIPKFGSELKAYFKRVQSGPTTQYPPLDNPDPYDIAVWMGQVLSAQPLGGVDKTAEVYDYENRIYRVDLVAQSGFKAIASDLALAFVTDISNSMLFPEDLTGVYDRYGNKVTIYSKDASKSVSLGAQIDNKVNAGLMNTDTVYMTIGDKNLTSTQYAIFYAHHSERRWINNQWVWGEYINDHFFQEGWWGLDASYYAKWMTSTSIMSWQAIENGNRWKQLSSTYQFANNELGIDDYEYVIYEPNDYWEHSFLSEEALYARSEDGAFSNRLYYLVTSIKMALDQIQKVSERYPLGAVYTGLETFAGSTELDNQTIINQTVGAQTNWPNLHQDFVQIGGSVNYTGGDYDDAMDEMLYKLGNITTRDGTRQDVAIQQLKNILHWSNLHDNENSKKYVILITDGAPNGRYKPADKKIYLPVKYVVDNINNEKGSGGSLDGVNLITVGLGIDDVPGGQQLLHDTATHNDADQPMYYNARNGQDLMYILMEIVRQIMEDAAVDADVTDVIDPAFYPVDKTTGLPPVLDGEGKAYIGLNGDVLPGKPNSGPYGELTYNSASDSWTVNWKDQDIKPETFGGWHGTVFMKVKEDFLGGNTINTNTEASMTPKSYHTIDDNGNPKSESIPIPEPTDAYDTRRDPVPLETPHVNVDELSLTEHSSEWTIYVDTTVSPRDELKELYKKIMVNEVVDATVKVNNEPEHKINDGHTSYTIVENSTADNTQTVYPQEQFALTDIPGMGVDELD